MRHSVRILVNSMPKSGTSLLIKTVELLGFRNVPRTYGISQSILSKIGLSIPHILSYQTVSKHHMSHFYRLFNKIQKGAFIPIGVTTPVQIPSIIVSFWLRQIPRENYYVAGHIPFSRNLDTLLQQLGYKHILIIRDLRDVLVSFLHFILRLRPEHPLSADFQHLSEDERVKFAINGGYLPISKRQILGIGNAFRSVVDWKQSQNCLIVRFEDLIGEKGGGSSKMQYDTIKRTCNYLQIDLEEREIVRICKSVFDSTAPTFRRGQIGSWKSELKPEWIKIFNQSYSELLSELQYE